MLENDRNTKIKILGCCKLINFKKNLSRRKYATAGALIVAVFIVVVTKNLVFIATPFIALFFLKLLDLQKDLLRANERIETLKKSFDDQKILGGIEQQYRNEIDSLTFALKGLDQEYRDEVDSLVCDLKDIHGNIHQSLGKLNLDLDSLKENFECDIQIKLANLMKSWLLDEDIKNVININIEGFVRAIIDKSVDKQFKIIKQLISQTYSYDLIIDRKESRQVFIDALKVSQQRLILVCPWISDRSIIFGVLAAIEDALIKGVSIDIGYGHSNDLDKKSLSISGVGLKIRELPPSELWKYSGIPDLEKLQLKYPKFLKLTILGTHEKIIICDQKFAMIGSHNYMTSLACNEREMGIKTNDPEIISKLIKRFDSSKDEKFDNAGGHQKPKLAKNAQRAKNV